MGFKSRTMTNTRTAISRIALWLIPVYAVTSPSLSGLNFLMACIVPSSSRLCALYTRPYVPEEMNPRMLYFERTERWFASRFARYRRIGSCWSALVDQSSSISAKWKASVTWSNILTKNYTTSTKSFEVRISSTSNFTRSTWRNHLSRRTISKFYLLQGLSESMHTRRPITISFISTIRSAQVFPSLTVPLEHRETQLWRRLCAYTLRPFSVLWHNTMPPDQSLRSKCMGECGKKTALLNCRFSLSYP